MKLKEYLDLKKIRELEKKKHEGARRDLCLKCLRPKKACFCVDINPLNTKSKFIILIHPMEAKKEKIATGRLAHLCLNDSKLVMGTNFTYDKYINSVLNNDEYIPYLLYPGIDSHNITNGPINEEHGFIKGKTPVFIIIDATWPHAKSMMKKSINLHEIRRVSFSPPGKSKFHIKQQPDENCLCTIESIYYLIDGLNNNGQENFKKNEHSILLKKLDDLVDYQIKCTLDPTLKSYRKGKYKTSDKRPYSKKWLKRSVCYESKNHS